jgi:hypothetical protein
VRLFRGEDLWVRPEDTTEKSRSRAGRSDQEYESILHALHSFTRLAEGWAAFGGARSIPESEVGGCEPEGLAHSLRVHA